MRNVKLFRKYFFVITNSIRIMTYLDELTALVTVYVSKGKIGEKIKQIFINILKHVVREKSH